MVRRQFPLSRQTVSGKSGPIEPAGSSLGDKKSATGKPRSTLAAARQAAATLMLYASFKPAPRSPRNSMPLAVTANFEPGWAAAGAT